MPFDFTQPRAADLSRLGAVRGQAPEVIENMEDVQAPPKSKTEKLVKRDFKLGCSSLWSQRNC